MGPNGLSGLAGGLSQRKPRQLAIAVTEVAAGIGTGSAGDVNVHAVFCEDVENVKITIKEVGGVNPLTTCKVQGNNFSGRESDSHWEDVTDLAPLAQGTQKFALVQGRVWKWIRVLGATDAGKVASVDLAWTGE